MINASHPQKGELLQDIARVGSDHEEEGRGTETDPEAPDSPEIEESKDATGEEE